MLSAGTRNSWPKSTYLQKKFDQIFFSSGELDPWSGSTVTEKSLEGADPSLIVISIPNAAHHYDIRASHPMDTREIIDARNRMKSIIQTWINAGSRSLIKFTDATKVK